MNRQVFLNLVENPHLLGADTLDGLALIVADYPFSQTARMLYVKNLAVVESIKYNSVLKTSAAFITHRNKLYDLVHSEPQPAKTNVPTPNLLDSNIEIVANNEQDHEISVDETQKEELTFKPLTDSSLTELTSPPIDYFEVSDEMDLSFLVSSKTSITPITKSNLEIEEINYIDVPIQNYPAVDLLDFEGENNCGYNVESDLGSTEPEDLTFSDWLIRMRQQKRVIAEVAIPQKNEKMDLINNFLKTKPKRIPRMVDFSATEEPQRKVYDKSDNLLTETLANLYIKQTHFDKAIKIFEKLCLKYPEKNAYFANRINEVEKLINNNL